MSTIGGSTGAGERAGAGVGAMVGGGSSTLAVVAWSDCRGGDKKGTLGVVMSGSWGRRNEGGVGGGGGRGCIGENGQGDTDLVLASRALAGRGSLVCMIGVGDGAGTCWAGIGDGGDCVAWEVTRPRILAIST